MYQPHLALRSIALTCLHLNEAPIQFFSYIAVCVITLVAVAPALHHQQVAAMQYPPIKDSNLLLQQAMFESSYAAVTALALTAVTHHALPRQAETCIRLHRFLCMQLLCH